MLKKFNTFIYVFITVLLAQTPVWSNHWDSFFENTTPTFSSEETPEIIFSHLHSIESKHEILVAEKETEEEQKDKTLIYECATHYNQKYFVVLYCLYTSQPDSYFSNHLYDLFCSWKSFLYI